MNAPVAKKMLPAGFEDITQKVVQKSYERAKKKKVEKDDGTTSWEEQRFSDGEQEAIKHIMHHVVVYQGHFLTCFSDNKPVVGNDLRATIDVCAMHTLALSRGKIAHVLQRAPITFQRYAYYPGFPRFLLVDGATCYNTWHPAQRLQVSDSQLKQWMSGKRSALVVAKDFEVDGRTKAVEAFLLETFPRIWRVMLRMLFGNENSPTASPNWIEEHEVFTKWFACVVHKPLDRIRWAPVLRGAHGIGKGTFQYLAQALMGSGSVRTVHNLEGIAGQFAGENALTRLLVVDEVWSKSGKAMEQFKPIISEDYVQVERKGEQRFSTRAVHDTIVFSNHHTPFTVAETERRWWVTAYRDYDMEVDASRELKQAFHAEGNRLIREALPLSPSGNQDQIRDLLCWLKLVAATVPPSFFAVAPSSFGLTELVDTVASEAYDDITTWLSSLGARDALSLDQVVTSSGIPQGELKPLLSKYGFRNCQMKREGNRKVWTKAAPGTGPNTLVTYLS